MKTELTFCRIGLESVSLDLEEEHLSGHLAEDIGTDLMPLGNSKVTTCDLPVRGQLDPRTDKNRQKKSP